MKIVGEGFAGVATAATRVIELYCPEEERLFHDPYALRLLPPAWQILFRLVYLPGLRQLVLSLREKRMPGSLGGILCRTRYIDDLLRESLQGGIEQVIILGAGSSMAALSISPARPQKSEPHPEANSEKSVANWLHPGAAARSRVGACRPVSGRIRPGPG